MHLVVYPSVDSSLQKILSMNGSVSTQIPKDDADGFGLVNGTDGYQKVEGNQVTRPKKNHRGWVGKDFGGPRNIGV